MDEAKQDRLITAAEVAGIYGIHEKTVWAWARDRRIPQPQVQRRGYTRWLLSAILDDIRTAQRAAMEEAAT